MFEVLREHPDVFLPIAKDLYFFDRYYERGLPWYERHFDGAQGKRAVGEMSHDYLFSEAACERIHATLPQVQLLTCLRDPVERAFSEYLFLRKHALLGEREGLREATLRYPSILEGGLYGRHLRHYFERFPRSQLLVQSFDDLRSDSRAFLRQLLAFLGVDANYNPAKLSTRTLPAARARVPAIARAAKWSAVALRGLGGANLLGRLKRSALVNHLLYVPYSAAERPALSDEERGWLADYYAADLCSLEELVGRSFGWREPKERRKTSIA